MRSMADIVVPNTAPVKNDRPQRAKTGIPDRKVAKTNSVGCVLAANLRVIIDAERVSPSAWARIHRLPARNVHNILEAKHSPSLCLIDEVARAAGLRAWQILVP